MGGQGLSVFLFAAGIRVAEVLPESPFHERKADLFKKSDLELFQERCVFFGHCMFEAIVLEDIDWKQEDLDLWEDAWALCFHSDW